MISSSAAAALDAADMAAFEEADVDGGDLTALGAAEEDDAADGPAVESADTAAADIAALDHADADAADGAAVESADPDAAATLDLNLDVSGDGKEIGGGDDDELETSWEEDEEGSEVSYEQSDTVKILTQLLPFYGQGDESVENLVKVRGGGGGGG